ncbi:hypothetical protein RvY_02762-2 [Ramazzottius varieornatus]|uniref:Sorting nexin/Vps5-like C-terminal domain-containing protein n=1 Tax=Ramazzottius varieornatus TaxID=947166 RepID=A0A1D1ULL6_RAMVA|nr:hypothetical protein RvY_02762-2 [Ramazzottius varieornatus]
MMDASELVFQNDQPLPMRSTLLPTFSVSVMDKTEKVGEKTYFFISVQKLLYGDLQDESEIRRSIEDFRSLDRRIRVEISENMPGIIAPRLSNRETTLTEDIPDNHARFMGKYASERIILQRYLITVLAHPYIGQHKLTSDFLTSPESSVVNYKFSLGRRMTGAFEDLWGSSYTDPDPYFEERKQKMAAYSGTVTEFANAFSLQNINKKNLSSTLALLSHSLESNGHPKDSLLKLWNIAAEVIKQEEYGWHLAYWNGELTLGTFLKHHIAQMDSFKDMMQRRTSLLQELDNAKKTSEKAKPPKKEAAHLALAKAEEAVQRSTVTGKQEIHRLKEAETKGFRQALIDYAESQMKAAQETYEVLLEQIRRIHEWEPAFPDEDDTSIPTSDSNSSL